jgi:hypothetical protein
LVVDPPKLLRFDCKRIGEFVFMKKLSWAAVALSAALAFSGIQPARADSVDYGLTAGNPGLNGYSGPYGNVDVSLTDSTHATITFTSLSSAPGNGFMIGGGGVNVNASSFAAGSFTLGTTGTTGFLPGSVATDFNKNQDGFGSFELIFNLSGGYTTTANSIQFVLTDLSGTWSSAANVLTGNNDNNLVAAHIFVCGSSPCAAGNNTGNTGFATATADPVPARPVPGPIFGGGLPGLIAACAGLVAFARRRRSRFA